MQATELSEYDAYLERKAALGTPYYRFNDGVFIEASSFEEAQQKRIEEILNEKEDEKNWNACTCLGLSHRHECPAAPHNLGAIAF